MFLCDNITSASDWYDREITTRFVSEMQWLDQFQTTPQYFRILYQDYGSDKEDEVQVKDKDQDQDQGDGDVNEDDYWPSYMAERNTSEYYINIINQTNTTRFRLRITFRIRIRMMVITKRMIIGKRGFACKPILHGWQAPFEQFLGTQHCKIFCQDYGSNKEDEVQVKNQDQD